jgi:hypothetical protein
VEMYNKILAQSPRSDLQNWALYNTGKSFLKSEKNPEAQKAFNQIKNISGPDGFWAQVVDYYIYDQKWWNKNREYLK